MTRAQSEKLTSTLMKDKKCKSERKQGKRIPIKGHFNTQVYFELLTTLGPGQGEVTKGLQEYINCKKEP